MILKFYLNGGHCKRLFVILREKFGPGGVDSVERVNSQRVHFLGSFKMF